MAREKSRWLRYQEYLAGEVWAEKRAVKLAAHKTCQVPGCGISHGLQVHHKKYPRTFGSEPLAWLIVLCRDHHKAVHVIQKEQALNLRRATRMVIARVK